MVKALSVRVSETGDIEFHFLGSLYTNTNKSFF